MRFRRASTHPTVSAKTFPQVLLLSLSLLLAVPHIQAQVITPSAAQQATAPQADESPYTLHVYTDLVEIPTLVLSSTFQAFPLLRADTFNITLDSGPPFHPTHVRLEGDDPIDLAILLDTSSDAYTMQSVLRRSMLTFATEALRPQDQVSIYAIDCAFIRSAEDVPANDTHRIAHDLEAAIDYPLLHVKGQTRPHCAGSVKLWNTVATVAASIHAMPGRRVILVVSSGKDHHSSFKWRVLTHYAAVNSVSIFGLSLPPSFSSRPVLSYTNPEDPFQQICQLTGGIVLVSPLAGVLASMERFMELVRGRYILEFPRPDTGSPGAHTIVVKLVGREAFIRTAGITFPQADPALRSDPATITNPPSPATFGTQRPVDPHR